MIHDSNAGAQAVVSHMDAPGADGWYFYPYVLRARIRSGRSCQNVVDLAGTGSPVGGVLNWVGCALPYQVLRATRP